MQRVPIICILLATITAMLFSPVTHFAFLNCDDHTYVVDNTAIHEGVTGAGIIWALKTNHASNWHPVTWISHMLDCEVFGPNPAGHHLTNAVIHTANSVLLFLVLLQLTGATWRSALVAALFAWHPMHVESVAWVSERKDVLSTFFALLTIAAYARYARESKVQSPKSKVQTSKFECEEQTDAETRVMAPNQKSKIKNQKFTLYLLSLFFFALGLMSKPMLVTLPCVLLLLDFWPLGRVTIPDLRITGSRIWGRLVVEKLPFLALAAFDCLATIWAQKSADSVINLTDLPLSLRAANAVVSYARYLGKLAWPADLAMFYPYPDRWAAWAVAGSLLLLIAISMATLLLARSLPFFLIGWLWFLGTLVPVIGFAQVGIQSMADRYSYLPSIGIFIIVAWGIAAFVEWRPAARMFLYACVGVWLAALIYVTNGQLQFWRDSATLFAHALTVTPDNIFAEYNLGQALDAQGRKAEAVVHYARAVALQPGRAEASHNSQSVAHENWGVILGNEQKLSEAEAQFRAAIAEKPRFWQAHESLALVLGLESRPGEAVEEFRTVTQLNPRRSEAWRQLGAALQSQGKTNEAMEALREAARLSPSGIPSR